MHDYYLLIPDSSVTLRQRTQKYAFDLYIYFNFYNKSHPEEKVGAEVSATTI